MNTNKKYSLMFFFLLFTFNIFNFDNKLPFLVEDEKGKIIDLAKTNHKSIVICFNYYNCINCFEIISKLKTDFPNYNFYFLARLEKNDLFNKRKTKLFINKNFTKYFQKDIIVYFDIHFGKDPWPPINLQEGIFAKYKITKTPAYFILTKDTLIFVPYEQIEKEMYK
ncbi:MAG: hypothetical protein QXY47_06145 [Thermoplasmata archaeon]